MNKTRFYMFIGVLLLSLALVGMALAADNSQQQPPTTGGTSTGTAPVGEGNGGVDSLSGSYVAFDPSVGGDVCYVPGNTQTFCFRAESFTTDYAWVYNLWEKFPTDWTVTNVYVQGTPTCDSGSWGTFGWSFQTAPYEVNIYHPRYQVTSDHCTAYYCFEVIAGTGAPDALESWYWAGDNYGNPPYHPCSNDVYTPAGQAACDEAVNPLAAIPACTLEPGLFLNPPELNASGCNGLPQVHTFSLFNNTGAYGVFDLTYNAPAGMATLTGPDTIPVSNGANVPFEVILEPNVCTFDTIVASILAEGNGYADTSIITKTISDVPSWETVPASAPTWAGNGYPRDGCTARNGAGEWVTYLLGDTSNIFGFWGYNLTTNTWFQPGSANTPPDRWAPDWAYDPETNQCYVTGGANTPGGGTYAEAYLFDPVANVFVPLENFTSVRDFHNSWVGTIDGTKYLCIGGGVNSAGVMIQATQCYDLSAGFWAPENATMVPFPTDPFGAADGILHAVTGDQFWYVGGAINAGGIISDEAHYWDDADNSWHFAGNTGVPRFRVEGDFFNGDFYQLGGSSGGFSPTADVVRGRFDGTNWVWSALPLLNNIRMDNVVGVTDNNVWSIDGHGANASSYVERLVYCPLCLQPIIQVDPLSMAATQPPDTITSQTLRISNVGGAPLDWSLTELPGVQNVNKGSELKSPFSNSAEIPEGYIPTLTRSENKGTLAGTVGLFKDTDPWGSVAWETIMTANGIPYEVHNSVEFAALDFDQFGMIIIACVQEQPFYDAYAANFAKFEAYVANGGFLNFCAATQSYITWPAPLPGGMIPGYLLEDYNVIDDPAHPVVAGVPNPFWGNAASHDILTNLPGYAHIIVHGQSSGAPTMVEYGIGLGWMIAYGQTLEYTYEAGLDGWPIIPNAIFFGYNWGGQFDNPWLSENPTAGSLLPGEFIDIVVTFDSAGLMPGDYFGGLAIDSNDPEEPEIGVPVQLTVAPPPPITWEKFINGQAWYPGITVTVVTSDVIMVEEVLHLLPQAPLGPITIDQSDTAQMQPRSPTIPSKTPETVSGVQPAHQTLPASPHKTLQASGLLYLTSLDIGDATFAVYDPDTDSWAALTPYETGCQMAVNSAGQLYAYGFGTGTIDLYDPTTDTWSPVLPAPPGSTGDMCNLKITNAGEFLYTERMGTTLWYTIGGVWSTLALPFTTNAMGDYDPTTDQYVIGEAWTTNAHWIDLNTWTITDYFSPVGNGENARFSVVMDNRYYFEAGYSNIYSFDLSNPALPPMDHGVNWGFYTSAAGDRANMVIYNASLDSTELVLFDPATNTLSPLTGDGYAWHSSVAFVPYAGQQGPIFAQIETWETDKLRLLDWAADYGSVFVQPDFVEWTGEIIEPLTVHLTKWFHVEPGDWTDTVLWEELWLDQVELEQRPVNITHNIDVPDITVDPLQLDATLYPDQQEVQQLNVCNYGEAPLTWDLSEVLPGMLGNLPSAPTDIGYALDIGYISDNFVSFVLNDFTGQTVIGTNTNAYYGIDFDPTATTLYALNDTTDQLGTIDLGTGAFTGLVSCPPGGGAANWTGLSIDPISGVFYASTATDLYTIDPLTGISTLVGPFGTSLMIEIAMGPNGEMYGHDIGTDSIYQIDPTTGTATLIGLTGYAANYAQGMDFDNQDGTLYIWLYIGAGANLYGTVNLSTGTVTPLAVDAPLGEFEGATQTTAGLPPDLSWLSENPISGEVLPDECSTVDVTFDSTGLVPDIYTGALDVNSNDPDEPTVNVPVTLTVLGVPDIEVTAPPLEMTLQPDQTATLNMTISNAGTADLDWYFTDDQPWLSEVPDAGIMPAGGSTPVVVTFDSTLLAPGVYETDLLITSNDPDEPTVTLPVTLTVVTPDILVTAPPLELTLFPNQTGMLNFTIANVGTYELDWSLTEDAAWLSENPTFGLIAPAGSIQVDVTFDSTGLAPGEYVTDIVITSDDPDEGEITLPATLTVSEYTADLSLNKSGEPGKVKVGDTITYSLEVQNLGPDTATSITLVDILPAEVVFVSATEGCVEDPTGTVTCAIDDMVMSESVTITIVVEAITVGHAINNAYVSSEITDPIMGNNESSTTTVIGPAYLYIYLPIIQK